MTSANIGAQYLYRIPFDPEKDAHVEGDEAKARGSREPWWKWHDSLTRFEGPIVAEINRHFRDRWILDGGAPFEPVSASWTGSAQRGTALNAAKVFTNEPNDRPNEIRELYVGMIARAERSIFLENPYIYHQAIAASLVRAKEKRPNLEITLILPAGKWNDNAFAHDAQQHLYEAYLRCGIEVYEYQAHFTHLKVAVFDERWSVHGSTNLNYRSLEDDKDFELVVCVDDAPFAKDVLTRVREVDVRHSRRVTLDDLGGSLAGLRIKTRDPRTLLLLSRRAL
jgi:cardiolipin synthase